ncbi:MAG: tryptophan synthase subunit alpha [Planctomycetota bacterium]|nr:tryptophan synthase subunit alpha [Planctomycetota bacterium]
MDTEPGKNRIEIALANQPAGLWPFLPAAYPDIETTASLLRAFAGLPIRGVELGFPFSDPIADGPVIQQAFSHALARGIRVADIFEMVAAVRRRADYPILAMVSVSIVYRIGVKEFVSQAASAGFDGLIVPDISLEEAPDLAEIAGAAGLRLSMLIAPTTEPDRERRIAHIAGGFLYYVSVQGTTGERTALPADLRDQVAELRTATGLPVIVGFGISTSHQVEDVCGFADGAIVGSAIVRRIGKLMGDGQGCQAIAQDVCRFVAGLAGHGG